MDLTVVDRRFRAALLLWVLVFGALDFWAAGAQPLYKSLFVIGVAGLVGYFTNFLAIKMLFQPKRGQVLGWRGLVPKNQAQIARSLAESVQEQLLSPDIILAYIRERKLIEQATQSLERWLDRGLQNPDTRRQLTSGLIDLLERRGADWVAAGFDVSEQGLKRAARDPALIAGLWGPIREMLVEIAASEGNRQQAAARLQSLLSEHLPQIATWLDEALEEFLRRRKTVGSFGMGLKTMVSFDREAIAQWLQRFAEDPRMAEQLVQGLDAVFDMLQQELETEQTQEWVQTKLAQWVDQLAALARRHVLPGGIASLNEFLADEGNWALLERQLVQVLQWAKSRALEMLYSASGQTTLRQLIERAVKRLNVTELVEEQVMKLDTDELEQMVLDNTGGNLTVIQVLGGVLGIVAGTVQVHLAFALPILALLAVVWCAWQINEWQQRRLP